MLGQTKTRLLAKSVREEVEPSVDQAPGGCHQKCRIQPLQALTENAYLERRGESTVWHALGLHSGALSPVRDATMRRKPFPAQLLSIGDVLPP